MTELTLTYVGTVLIAMEFVRKFTHLQALTGMLIGWPVSPFLREIEEKGFGNWYEVYFKAHKPNVIFRMISSAILCFITLPLTVTFYAIWFIILILNSFHNWVNRVYFEGKKRYYPVYMLIIGLVLPVYKMSEPKRYAEVNEQKVMQEIERIDIPILPIIGVILISIAFVLFIV